MNTPNKLTLFRILIVPFFVISFIYEYNCEKSVFLISTILFIIASVTDFFDGYLARKYNLVTDFGKFLDPLADKILVASAIIMLSSIGKIPGYIVIIIVSREYMVSILRAVAASKGKVIAAIKSGKLKTVTQMVSTILMMLNVKYSIYLVYLAAFITLYSGFEYLVKNKEFISEK